MKTKLIVAAILAGVFGACSMTGKPTAEEYAAAQECIEQAAAGAHVDQTTLEAAEAIVRAFEDPPGIDWLALLGAAGGALLGVPALGSRGREVLRAGVGALAHGDLRKAAKAAVAYVGTTHSTKQAKKKGGRAAGG